MGIFGGYATPPVFIQMVRESNMKSLLAKSSSSINSALEQLYEGTNPEEGKRSYDHVTMKVQPLLNGETFYVPVGGGAGYGDALERDPEAVIEDLRNRVITDWAAKSIYKIAYDEKTLRLFPEETALLREKARDERKQKGKPYEDFEKEWLAQRPPDQAIKYYGSYPDPGKALQADSDLPPRETSDGKEAE
jgi:acetophenone carboxylase